MTNDHQERIGKEENRKGRDQERKRLGKKIGKEENRTCEVKPYFEVGEVPETDLGQEVESGEPPPLSSSDENDEDLIQKRLP